MTGYTNRQLLYNNFKSTISHLMRKHNCLTINQRLTQKYDIHFNFFLTKPTNQIVFNHTVATTTIDFKDTIIYADNNEYLKRYYFLVNSLGKQEIFDRINLLAQFYGNAVILRYEYPSMILTRTKAVFLKRLKRMKKMIVEEGSSDQSNSRSDQKVVSINSSKFLRSIDSSELQRKSLDEPSNIQLDFSLWKDQQPEVHDIFDQNEEQQNSLLQNNIFLSKITKFSKEISCQLNLQLQHKQEEINHLLIDFDQFDQDQVIKKYQKIIDKQNRQSNTTKQSVIRRQLSTKSNKLQLQPQRIKELIEKKPMTSSITITALEDQSHNLSNNNHVYNKDHFKKKSMMSPRYSENPIQQQNKQPYNKQSSIYQYEIEHTHFPIPNQFMIAEDQKEDSPRGIPRYHPTMENQSEEYHRNPINSYSSREELKYPKKPWMPNSPKTKYSSILNNEEYRSHSKISNEREFNERSKPSTLRNFQLKGDPAVPYSTARYLNPSLSPQNRMTSINININNLEEKKEEHRVNVKVNKNKFDQGEDKTQQDRNNRAQKKKKIRQKAAALLNRVKSQELMRPVQQFQPLESNRGYYERYYL